MAHEKDHYMQWWKGVLGTILGWTSEQVEQWAHKWDPHGIDDENSLFYHEAPSWYVANILIPDYLTDECNTTTIVKLDRQIEHALNFDDNAQYVALQLETYDFEAAKRRVEAVLKKYENELRKRRQ
jgi:hypothetical protein